MREFRRLFRDELGRGVVDDEIVLDAEIIDCEHAHV
jgi:hypothetical protein